MQYLPVSFKFLSTDWINSKLKSKSFVIFILTGVNAANFLHIRFSSTGSRDLSWLNSKIQENMKLKEPNLHWADRVRNIVKAMGSARST